MSERPEPPAELVEAPDMRTTDLRADLQRCARLLRWIEDCPAPPLVSAQKPVVDDDLVSIVLPMYNASPFIESCLKGLLLQTHGNLEIFCVDDHSTDGTWERVVEQFGHDGRVAVIRLAQNVGPFQISNWLATLARGRRIAFQDADNVSHPRRIEHTQSWMSEHGFRVASTGVHHFFPPALPRYWPEQEPYEADGRLHELLYHLSLRAAAPAEKRTRDFQQAWARNEVGPAAAQRHGVDVPIFAFRGTSVCLHGSQAVDADLFRELGGYYGRTKLGEDTEFDWRALRFDDVGNLPHIYSSRRSHDASLTRDSATGMKSDARRAYRRRMRARQDEITGALEAGDTRRARELCTEDLHCAEIQVERAHCPFDIALP